MYIFFAAFAVFVVFLVSVLLQASRERLQKGVIYGIPGKIVYRDDGTVKPLSYKWDEEGVELIGKPDYIIQKKNGDLVILDLKSGKAHEEVRPAYAMQLQVYRKLVEENFKKKVSEMNLFYLDDRTLKHVRFDSNLESRTLRHIRKIKKLKESGVLPNATAKEEYICRNCNWREVCTQKLA